MLCLPTQHYKKPCSNAKKSTIKPKKQAKFSWSSSQLNIFINSDKDNKPFSMLKLSAKSSGKTKKHSRKVSPNLKTPFELTNFSEEARV